MSGIIIYCVTDALGKDPKDWDRDGDGDVLDLGLLWLLLLLQEADY